MSDDEDGPIEPLAPFYLSFPLGRADGKIDGGDIGDGRCIWRDLDCASSWAESEAHSGLETVIYKCIPIRRAWRPAPEIEVLGKAPASNAVKKRVRR